MIGCGTAGGSEDGACVNAGITGSGPEGGSKDGACVNAGMIGNGTEGGREDEGVGIEDGTGGVQLELGNILRLETGGLSNSSISAEPSEDRLPLLSMDTIISTSELPDRSRFWPASEPGCIRV